MGSSKEDLKKAAKELRTRLELSQEAFGQLIGRTLNTVLRYESQVGPKDEALVRYTALAIDSGFTDLAQVFQAALIKGLGSDLVRVLTWKADHKNLATSPVMNEEISVLVDAFLDFMSRPNQDLQPAESIARTSIKQMLLKQHPAEKLGIRKKR